MKTKTHKKFNISLPEDLHAWCVQKQREEQQKTQFGKIHLSNIIARAVEEMMQSDTKPAKPAAVRHAPISSAPLKRVRTK